MGGKRTSISPFSDRLLGTPFIFLLTEDDHTYCYAREADLPKSLDLYETIQARVFTEVRSGNPVIVDADKMPKPPAPEEKEVLKKLNGAAFIPLTMHEDVRLSVGLLSADPALLPLAEPPAEMASVLAKHLKFPVIMPLLAVLRKWTEHRNRTEQETTRRQLMGITAEVCLSVGRYQLSDLQQMRRSFPALDENNDFRRLQNMAEGLQATGSMLESLAKADVRKEQGRLPAAGVQLNQFIKSVWTDLDNVVLQNALTVYGDCDVHARQEDLSVMVSSILQWFAQRFIDTPSEIEPYITVRCHRDEKGAELIFEDRSARLDKVLREHLFDPFTESITVLADHDDSNSGAKLHSSLFMAKLLVETRYNGVLEDISDAIVGSSTENGVICGLRFRMCFPNLQVEEVHPLSA
jgi:hypothetical protein